MTTTNLSGKRLLPGSVDFNKLDTITQATINSLLAGSKRLADIAGVQTDATLNPGASPAAGTRYLLLDVAHLHASFGTIAGVGDGDIVAYSGSAWVVDVDFSAATQTLNVWNDGDKHYWIGDPEASGVKWKQSLGAGDFPFDPTTSIVPDDKVTVQQALAWLAGATDVSVVSVDFLVAASADVAGFTAGAVRDGHTLAAGQKLLVSDSAGPDFKVVYTVQASGAPTLTTARRPGRTYFIAWANGYDSLNYPGGVYTCGPGAAGYESYRLSQSSTAGLTHNDPLLGLVTVAGKFADQDAKIAAAAAGNPMQYAAEAADGVLKVFTLPFTITANSKIFVDGMLARVGAGNDYTYSGAVVTLNAAGPAPVSWVGGTVS